jgi:hypothetical protein
VVSTQSLSGTSSPICRIAVVNASSASTAWREYTGSAPYHETIPCAPGASLNGASR